MITHAGTPAGTLTLTATPASTGTPVGGAAVRPGPAPGSYGATLRVTGAGAWELAVDDGERTARVPFVVTGQVTPPPEKAVHPGFAATGVLLLVAPRRGGARPAYVVGRAARHGRGGRRRGRGDRRGALRVLPLPPQPGIQVVDATGAAAQAAPAWVHAYSMGDLTPMPGMAGGSGGARAAGMAGLMPVNGDSAADETVAAYRPRISFTYTFARPGRYRAWIQVERDYRILTVPILLDITKAATR